MAPADALRIVTRSSPMALAQAGRVRAELAARHPGTAVRVVPVTPYGDRWTGSLCRFGGKAAFTREVDAVLLAGGADVAVHCMKDVPGDEPPPPGTLFAAYLRRDDVRDALVHPGGLTLDELPPGTRVGTSSVRRVAQLTASHPHLCCVPMRGAVNRRLARLDGERADALVLALCGLLRIGAGDRVTQVLPLAAMCPPLGAGVLGLRCRTADRATLALVRELDDAPTAAATTAEQALLRTLRGHCNSPVAGLARPAPDGSWHLAARVFSPDGGTVVTAEGTGGEPAALGAAVAEALLSRGARALIDAIPR
ncbi:hydroxymethylbilane synthase [Streptomyces sp. TRM 70351]|uniref:hydroxymethylbilane synthase n=1 Tax=Streptomyces sp. TRM 70351 TaxID=3116552 RepID=UPI002E7C4937|nr:hydroxymethylbilane synthase [Streptomyces sp. TRM 70351]MEE1928089.1 hydroxymethylbilane synthase [Streptomyces sp. TRM 70351]